MLEAMFDGRVALVTGAASGIGRATAELFAAHGAAVACADRNEAGVAQTADSIRARGGRALPLVEDLLQQGAAQALVARTVSEFGRLDHAFNNAGITGSHAEPFDAERNRLTLATNLDAVLRCMEFEVEQMLLQGGGTIVNTSSIAGLSGKAGALDYSAAKAGVVGLTRAAAWRYGPQGIRINAVCPGMILTPMTHAIEHEPDAFQSILDRLSPVTRQLGRPQDIAEAVVWLSSHKSNFIHGHALPVDGGFTI